MSLKAGIVGLPNVGKSTLFNAITNSKIEIANYPFATIEPNIGVVSLVDERLDFLHSYFNSDSKIENTFSFTDIAGIVKGASKGEGLGNKFLSNIREVDLIVHVVRCFQSNDIVHVEKNIDPKRDLEIINLELIISDIDIVSKRLYKIEKKADTTKDKFLVKEVNTLKSIQSWLESEKLIKDMPDLDSEEISYCKGMGLITSKPVIYIANVSEDSMYEDKVEEEIMPLKKALSSKEIIIPISAKIEHEISEIEDREDKELFMKELNLSESGLNKVSRVSMDTLGLGNFFTAGKQECRAWTFKKEESIKESASIIHTDISRGFISAEIYKVQDLKESKDLATLKSRGLLKNEGKNYSLNDGDVVFFKFNV